MPLRLSSSRARSPHLILLATKEVMAICGGYTAQHPDKVANLVLSGALWIEGFAPTGAPQESLGAYRTVDAESMMRRWSTGLQQHEIERIVSENDRRSWCQHTVSCDPTAAQTGLLRAPTGVMQDYVHCRESGEDWYDYKSDFGAGADRCWRT